MTVGDQNATMYTNTLGEYLLPFACCMLQVKWIFQQKNTSIRTANATNKWFMKKKRDIMRLLSKSPDLNPIENN